MGRQTKALYNQLIGMINKMQSTPAPVNEPQKFLTDKAMESARLLETGDFRTLPKNLFFNFQRPAEQMRQRQLLTNASQTGTFGLADNGGASRATALQGEYLKDKFARDSSESFQNNIANASQNVYSALGQSSNAEAQRLAFENDRQMAIMGALNNLYQFKKQSNQAGGFGSILGGILGAAGQMGSAAITKGGI